MFFFCFLFSAVFLNNFFESRVFDDIIAKLKCYANNSISNLIYIHICLGKIVNVGFGRNMKIESNIERSRRWRPSYNLRGLGGTFG